MKCFIKSFTLYVDSGMREKAEAEIEKMRNVEGESELLVREDFKARFSKLIIDHYLRKIHCFYINSTHLTTSFA